MNNGTFEVLFNSSQGSQHVYMFSLFRVKINGVLGVQPPAAMVDLSGKVQNWNWGSVLGNLHEY